VTPFEIEWLGGTAERWFRKVRPGVDELPWGTLDPNAYDPELVFRARRAWTVSAAQEYAAAMSFATVQYAMLRAGAPADLVGMAGGFVADEMVHVELNARIAGELGGGVPIDVDRDRLVPVAEGTALQVCNELIVRVCCVGETFSLPVLAGTMSVSTHPLVRAVLARIVRDEAPHGRLGWLYLGWVADRLDDAERQRLGEVALDALSALSYLWRDDASTTPPPDIHELGWMERGAYARAARKAARQRVVRPLRKLGIPIDRDKLATLTSLG
jgi:hypothetical protein